MERSKPGISEHEIACASSRRSPFFRRKILFFAPQESQTHQDHKRQGCKGGPGSRMQSQTRKATSKSWPLGVGRKVLRLCSKRPRRLPTQRDNFGTACHRNDRNGWGGSDRYRAKLIEIHLLLTFGLLRSSETCLLTPTG